MAMLAEPRRKQKIINLRAKNNAWSNDNTKFGQRMLEKMGWTTGKGLGANESGITEHVVARYKNDDKGLGFEDKNDQWTKHEDDFNALLANLSNASDNPETLHSGISLEDKSKKSKARIHYHKFTRGKDISRYSEKDLANIFGKKSFKNVEVVQETSKEDLKTNEQVFTEKGSMEDYFKNKLAVLKTKSKLSISNVRETDTDWDEACYNFRGFSQETEGAESSPENGYNHKHMSSNENIITNDILGNSEKNKKRKKSFKAELGENVGSSINIKQGDLNIQESQECFKEKNTKKRKTTYIDPVNNKTNGESIDQSTNHEIEQNSSDEKVVKKKKSKKEKIVTLQNINENEQQEGQKSSKKKKKKLITIENSEESVSFETCETNQKVENVTMNNDNKKNKPKKKKKRKCKEDSESIK